MLIIPRATTKVTDFLGEEGGGGTEDSTQGGGKIAERLREVGRRRWEVVFPR